MINYKDYFKNKKITVMGLGLLGRSISYIKFLIECGASLTVTDLKTKEQLSSSLKILLKYNNIKFVLGKHELKDFKKADIVIKAAGVSIDSIYIKEAHKNKIPVKMDASLFSKLVGKDIKIIGVTGTRGKTMTTTLIYEILKNNEKFLKCKVYIGGNIRGGATLPLIKKVKKGDIVVLELDSWQLQGFGEERISPHISVFTTFMPDHMNYYKNDINKYFSDKENIFKYQNKDNVLIVLPKIKKLIPKYVKSKIITANRKKILDWDFIVPGIHQRDNLACAVEVAEQLNIPILNVKKVIKNFKGVEGRLQLLRSYKGVNIYNDNNATTPEATIAGLQALGLNGKDIILIAGGATKGLGLSILIKTINKYCKEVLLLDGTGTQELIMNSNDKLIVPYQTFSNFKDLVKKSIDKTKKGDIILFSPAFASFGMFTNEYDRNDQFIKIIKKLK